MTADGGVQNIAEDAIRAVADLAEVRTAVRGALESLARGTVVQPDVIGMKPGAGAEVHVRGAFIHGRTDFVVKVVGGYPQRNPEVNQGPPAVYFSSTLRPAT